MGQGVWTALGYCRLLPLIAVVFTLWAVEGLYCHAVPSDGCDWTGSGLSLSTGQLPTGDPMHPQLPERGVQPLYLRCSQGRIRWSYPAGALRLVLRLQQGGEFRACLRPAKNFQGARIYLEGHRRLHLLYGNANDDIGHNDVASNVKRERKMRCFASVHGQAALYVEALSDSLLLRKTVAEFAYDLQPLDKARYEDDLQDCRPCSDDEILQAFCTSDFVVKGTVTSLYHNQASDLTELTVRAKKVVRDSEPAVFQRTQNVGAFKSAVLHRDIKCGTKAGNGQFLFLGRTVLDVPYVACAPRIGQWKKIRTKALMSGTNQCQLD